MKNIKEKCTNCGSNDHIAKFCYERSKKIPVAVKPMPKKANTANEKKEMKIAEKIEEIV